MDVRREVLAARRDVGTRTLEAGSAVVVTVARTFPTDPPDLWSACTDPDRLARWFLPVHGDLHVGGHYRLEGQANGRITSCDPPRGFDATWEYGGEVSWIEVRIHADGDGARVEIAHLSRVEDDEHWLRYGPAATGVGWDLGLVGLAAHLGDGGTPHGESDWWCASPDGAAFLAAAAEAWVPATVRYGLDADDARARADRVVAFFTGAEVS